MGGGIRPPARHPPLISVLHPASSRGPPARFSRCAGQGGIGCLPTHFSQGISCFMRGAPARFSQAHAGGIGHPPLTSPRANPASRGGHPPASPSACTGGGIGHSPVMSPSAESVTNERAGRPPGSHAGMWGSSSISPSLRQLHGGITGITW